MCHGRLDATAASVVSPAEPSGAGQLHGSQLASARVGRVLAMTSSERADSCRIGVLASVPKAARTRWRFVCVRVEGRSGARCKARQVPNQSRGWWGIP